MDFGQISGLVYGTLFVGLLLFAWWRLRRRGIGLREAFMGRKYTVEVEGDAQALCKRALLEVAGSRTTRKFKKHKLRAPTHLPCADGRPRTPAATRARDGHPPHVRAAACWCRYRCG